MGTRLFCLLARKDDAASLQPVELILCELTDLFLTFCDQGVTQDKDVVFEHEATLTSQLFGRRASALRVTVYQNRNDLDVGLEAEGGSSFFDPSDDRARSDSAKHVGSSPWGYVAIPVFIDVRPDGSHSHKRPDFSDQSKPEFTFVSEKFPENDSDQADGYY